jgi:bifunctional non-homologous end joining protein LigD
MSLDTYRRKRDFGRTPEPAGGPAPPAKGRRFVVQRHRATRLHYDFRLEIDGVLMSWAVPRGPSLNPAERRMAVHTEDHPLEYFDFEGTIPKGEYGGGDVIVWDWGTYEPEETEDAGAAVRNGELKFSLDGEKLRGRFTLVRIRSDDPAKDDWLLIHKKDEFADPEWDVDAQPRSVKTGRTNDEVAAGAAAVWDSAAPAAEATIDLSAARPAPLPDFIEPMKATAARGAFSDDDWYYELKLDGYRVEAVVENGRVRLWTRNRQDAGRYFPDLAAAPASWIRAETAIVDGEVVALNSEGKPEFGLLQDRAGMGRFGGSAGRSATGHGVPRGANAPIVYYVFDLLYHDGRSLLDVPLEQRKRLLRSVLSDQQKVRFSAHIEADGEGFYDVVREQGLEGVVAKLRHSRYEPGRRSRAWLKIKIRRQQEVLVCGYEPGKGSHAELGSLILCLYDEGELRYVGEVGSGLDARTRRQLKSELDEHALDVPPVSNPPRIKGVRWSAPRITVRVEYSDWTDDDLLRQAAYKGREIGRDPAGVVREREVSARSAATTAEKAAAAETAGAAKRAGARLAKPARPARPARPAEPAGTDAADAAPAAKVGGKSTARRPAGSGDDSKLGSRSRPAGRGRSGEVRPDPEADPPTSATAAELKALDELGREGELEIGGRLLRLTNLDKVLFPKPGLTKRDLIRYYVTVAPLMLPYLRGRALNLWRWPDGVEGKQFWQKEIPGHAPDWISRWSYPEAGSREAHTYIVADGVATMAWLANHATIDMHPWTSRTDAYKRPTYALIDIDPGEKTSWEEVLALTRLFRTALDHLHVKGRAKVTGKRGLQIWIPVRPIYTFEQTREWVEGISRAVGATVPELVSWEWGKASRRGRARLDFTQNAVNKTLVAPYAVRPVPDASVSAPISWDELEAPGLRPDAWNMNTILARIDERGDLFGPVLEVEQELPALS